MAMESGAIEIEYYLQKQPSSGVLRSRCSENRQQIKLLQSNFIENALRHGCSPVNSLHNSREPFLHASLNNTSGRLFLYIKMREYQGQYGNCYVHTTYSTSDFLITSGFFEFN